ncbi:hypothetical protein ANCDUO_09359 [Ancylostoma duodenale]|uniref:Uncharacterized protein n=1 Tax=Ancylostoma duodenale TaxID=51022 RepID=A0A0C2DDA8_9BILA|nr:hypothetical protein ANCDUO_09359 [Ancylostoma duodenale]
MYAEMAAWLQAQGKTFRYGFHLVRSSYWFTPSPAVTKELFGSLRKDLKVPSVLAELLLTEQLFQFPEKIGSQQVKSVRDLTIGYDNSMPDNKPVLPLSTTSEMITFNLASGSVATLRASGTEPKIKYYIELKTAPGKKER